MRRGSTRKARSVSPGSAGDMPESFAGYRQLADRRRMEAGMRGTTTGFLLGLALGVSGHGDGGDHGRSERVVSGLDRGGQRRRGLLGSLRLGVKQDD